MGGLGSGRPSAVRAGQNFGTLTAVARVGTMVRSKSAIWELLCACGVRTYVDAASLIKTPRRVCGSTCGCFAEPPAFYKKNLLKKTKTPQEHALRDDALPVSAADSRVAASVERCDGDLGPRRHGTVYFVQGAEGGPIKIGFTAGRVQARLAALQSGSPVTLRLLTAISGTTALEQDFHRRFESLRLHNEWFRPEPALLDFLVVVARAAKIEQQAAVRP